MTRHSQSPSDGSRLPLTQEDVDQLHAMLLFDPKSESCSASLELKLTVLPRYSCVGIYINQREGKTSKRPHFHAQVNGGESASYAIDDLQCLEGKIRREDDKKVRAWAGERHDRLVSAWNDLQAGRLPDVNLEASV